MQKNYTFLPMPRHLNWLEGTYTLVADRFISLSVPEPQAVRFSAGRFQAALTQQLDLDWEITAARALPVERVGLTLMLVPGAVAQLEGYHLRIMPHGITLNAHGPTGLFYGVSTLIQLLQQVAGPDLPCLEIKDWPDYPARGVMLDISRDKVPQMHTLFDLIDRLASWKINQVQLYTEHTFAYQNHPVVWEHASPLTGEEILALDAYCRERFIELVPNQNSFGHMRPWLIHAEYADLAETHDTIQTPWEGYTIQGPFGLTPENPDSMTLMRSLYDELLPHFTSRMLNVGCDEAIDLGQGVSKKICEERGIGRVYLDFVRKLYKDVSARGFTMQFWGDIIIHYPDLVPELPRDAIVLEWGYDAEHPFDEHGAQFAAAGVPFYVCPGTSSWCTIAGRTDNALANLLNAAENGLKHGACGYLNTDWGDWGHWQYLPVSYLGLGMGAAYAWCVDANRDVDVPRIISCFAFDDPSGVMGQIAYDLGNVYQLPGKILHNSSVLFWILQGRTNDRADWTPEGFQKTLAAIDAAIAPLDEIQMARADADLIKREYVNAAKLLRHACHCALTLFEQDTPAAQSQKLAADLEALLDEHRRLWHARNRPGGYDDSVARFDALRKELGSK